MIIQYELAIFNKRYKIKNGLPSVKFEDLGFVEDLLVTEEEKTSDKLLKTIYSKIFQKSMINVLS